MLQCVGEGDTDAVSDRPMLRALLNYQGDSIELPPGETVVGRGVACRIRFNDPSVSREHVRFSLAPEGLEIEDLGSSNGTLVNGDPIDGRQRLRHGDIVRIGRRVLRVALERGAEGNAVSSAETNRHEVLSAVIEQQIPDINCPQCRAWIPADLDQCPSCGNLLARGRPHSRTYVIKPGELDKERRMGRRYATVTPIFYTSANLAIDAQAQDLSLSGVFVSTDLLDDVGSECNITLLPDGGAPVHVAGVVRRVVAGDGAEASGMGVEFKAISESAEKWLLGYLQRIAG